MFNVVKTLKCISRNVQLKSFYRNYLSSAYKCQDAWNQRLESPFLKKVNGTDLFFDLENQFQKHGKAHGIDIDIFTNIAAEPERSDEIEDLLHKLRLSPEACSLLPSTQHAFIRFLVENDKTDDLLRVLDDRLNYGVFMDNYTCILLLNKFLKENNFKDSARVASFQMLQEDFSHPMVKFMCLYACLKYSESPSPWAEEAKPESESAEDIDEDEIIKLRVPYIRNYYFDDHFDLRIPSHLVGKTLWMIGCELPDAVGYTCQIIGLGMYNKWDRLKSLIEELLESNQSAHRNCLSILTSTFNNAKQNTPDNIGLIEEVEKLLGKMDSQNQLLQDDVVEIAKNQMLENIKTHEKSTIGSQVQIYAEWEKQREKLINEHIDMLKRDRMVEEIEEAKREMQETEEELFFFDNEDKLDLLIEHKYKPRFVTWRGYIKKKRDTNVEYVPPEIQKRREN
ncbi:28S ribosomal protein S27, mitochondrial [Nilaparvata lugens]|uniref:28S ribosomal protein S27, mitochondrial n=1 Tax=Nilaparvata lugens TaxID=108931 RepID=UPI00193D29BC|nr:28S ribosomal protein S27, mitochondrial [Nilaparvata lugens]